MQEEPSGNRVEKPAGEERPRPAVEQRPRLPGKLAGWSSAEQVVDALQAVGAFDPSLPACEDWDLVLRLAKRYSFDVVSRPAVHYAGSGADRMSARARAVFIANHRILRRYSRISFAHVARPVGSAVILPSILPYSGDSDAFLSFL